MGGDAGSALWVVGLSARADDRPEHRSLVWAADRGRLRLDRGHLHHGDCFRDRKALAGFGEAGQSRVPGRLSSSNPNFGQRKKQPP